MTPRNGIPICSRGPATVADGRQSPRIALADVTCSRRMWARLFATRYDLQIERGVTVAAGTPLAAHYLRLASRREREDLAAGLRRMLEDVGRLPSRPGVRLRVPLHAEAVERSAEVVQDVLARLLGPLPVRARGMARLRILLSDGRGPVYGPGRGTLAASMRGVLAAL